jgi:hypothetical protein
VVVVAEGSADEVVVATVTSVVEVVGPVLLLVLLLPSFVEAGLLPHADTSTANAPDMRRAARVFRLLVRSSATVPTAMTERYF